MAEIKHTPGPWIWADGHRGLYGAGKDNQVLDYAIYEGMWLGHVDEQKANALLIAAAPDLLEALRDMVSDHADLSEATLVFARAAIAKATGASHD